MLWLQRYYDLLLMITFALILPLTLWISIPMIQVPFGLGMALIAPGYTFVAALFAKRNDLEGIARAALSFGLSVAILPVLAFILDKLPWGIRPLPMTLAVSLWLTFCSLVAFVRRSRLMPSGLSFLPPIVHMPAGWSSLSPRVVRRRFYIGLASLAVLLVGTVLLIPANIIDSTEFYMLGESGLAQDYPRTAIVGEALSVKAGIKSDQQGVRDYRVETWLLDPVSLERQTLLGGSGRMTMALDEHREFPVTWRMPSVGNDQPVGVFLFVDDQVEPHRSLRLWVNVIAQ